jgi:hypothetical protein
MLTRVQAVLSLRDASELFEQPARSPLDDDYEPWCIQPGAEHLAQVLRSDPRANLVVELPATAPGTEQIRAALSRYSEARADELGHSIRGEVRHALWALIPTGAVFALTLGISRYADTVRSHWISVTIAEALVVIGWVVLWSPIAILGTDVWVLLGRRRAYRRLATRQVEIRTVTG